MSPQTSRDDGPFQSLRGFGVGWSATPSGPIAWHGSGIVVSIPERVWGGLEHQHGQPLYPGRASFNP